MFNTIKESVLYVLGVDLFLGLSSVWLYSLQTKMTILLSFLIGLAGLLVSIFSIIHLFLKIKSIRLDNELKELEILDKKYESESKTLKN